MEMEKKSDEEKQKLWRKEKKQTCLPRVDEEEEEEEEEEFDEAVKLGGVAMRLNIQLRSANMPYSMQEHAICFASLILHNSSSSPSPSLLARSLKKEFDSIYGRVWHCIVGKSFGSFVTHSPGGFIYFSIDSHNFSCLLFKTEVQIITVS